jgi:D-sedoheptulose 7-phosphate isomerase
MNIRNYFDKIKDLVGRIDESAVTELINHIENAYRHDKMIFLIGNGGSAANAAHFAQDLAKGVFAGKPNVRKIKALSLVDNTPFITALANDDGYDRIFDSQLDTFGSEGDYLIAISGSGNSNNIIRAVEMAKEKKIFVIAITGFDGGMLKNNADFSMHIPLHDMCSVESIHSIIFHAVVLALRERLTGNHFDEGLLS